MGVCGCDVCGCVCVMYVGVCVYVCVWEGVCGCGCVGVCGCDVCG